MGYISKKQREEIRQKFDGFCAYSGTPLEDDWQVDHVKPLIRNWFDGTSMFPDAHCDENFVPCQKIINHYKGSLDLETFRTWFLGGLHERMDKPKNPRTENQNAKRNILIKWLLILELLQQSPLTELSILRAWEKKKFNYGQVGTNITTKHRTKHGLYTMLCNRFNVAQRSCIWLVACKL